RPHVAREVYDRHDLATKIDQSAQIPRRAGRRCDWTDIDDFPHMRNGKREVRIAYTASYVLPHYDKLSIPRRRSKGSRNRVSRLSTTAVPSRPGDAAGLDSSSTSTSSASTMRDTMNPATGWLFRMTFGMMMYWWTPAGMGCTGNTRSN